MSPLYGVLLGAAVFNIAAFTWALKGFFRTPDGGTPPGMKRIQAAGLVTTLANIAALLSPRELPLALPLVAGALSNLGDFFRAKGDYVAAEPLFREALEMRRSCLGNDQQEQLRAEARNLEFPHRVGFNPLPMLMSPCAGAALRGAGRRMP